MIWVFLLLDLITKWCAVQWLHNVPVCEFGGIQFALTFATNTGAAWGLFAGHAGLLAFLRAAVIGAVAFFMQKGFAVRLILAGAIGNVLDYLLYGHVIDFFHFTFWGYSFPIFNVADSCISIGIAWLILFSKKSHAHIHS